MWVDANGFSRIQRVRTNAGAGPIVAQMGTMSQAAVMTTWESVETSVAPVPPGGAYRSAAQVAVLSFICADNTIAKLAIFSPSLSIFQADQETVDLTNAAVIALAALCVGNLESASGSLATALVAGSLSPSLQT